MPQLHRPGPPCPSPSRGTLAHLRRSLRAGARLPPGFRLRRTCLRAVTRSPLRRGNRLKGLSPPPATARVRPRSQRKARRLARALRRDQRLSGDSPRKRPVCPRTWPAPRPQSAGLHRGPGAGPPCPQPRALSSRRCAAGSFGWAGNPLARPLQAATLTALRWPSDRWRGFRERRRRDRSPQPLPGTGRH